MNRKIEVNLRSHHEGNAFYIIGAVKNQLLSDNMSQEFIDKTVKDMKSKDYKHLCKVAGRFVNLLNRN